MGRRLNPVLMNPFHDLLLLLMIMVSSLSLLPHSSSQLQLQPSQLQSLLTIQQLLNYYPSSLATTNASDICTFDPAPASSLTLQCYEGNITQLHFIGNISDEGGGVPASPLLLPQDFSSSSFFDSLAGISTLKVLSMVSLGLWGPLPPTIGQLSSLEILNLSSNSLSGVLPMELSSLKNLQTLILDHNYFTGAVPGWLTSLTALAVLSLDNNSFGGFLPNTMASLQNLRILSLPNNRLSGEVPDLHNLTNLQVLDLGGNSLGSQFPNISNRLVSLVLRNNSFHSGIPAEFLASSNQLQKLDISFNGFEGPISAPLLLSLPSISYLDVSNNKLTGMLSQNMSCNGQLSYVDLSSNRLSGELPACLKAVGSSTRVVVYADNCFSGKEQHQHPSYICHNEALAVKVYPRDKAKQTKVGSKVVVVASGAMGGTIGGIAIISLVFLFVRKANHKNAEKVAQTRLIMENVSTVNTVKLLSDARYISQTMKMGAGLPAYRTFALEELKEATNDFNVSNLLIEDTHSQVYRGKLTDGSDVAIKCLTLMKKQNQQTFTQQIELASKLRHGHLDITAAVEPILKAAVKPKAQTAHGMLMMAVVKEMMNLHLSPQRVCNQPREEHDEKKLRELTGPGAPQKKLTWVQRIGAAIGVARGVQFLHTGIVPGMFSINLKITDVLMDHNYHVKISSFNLPTFDGRKGTVAVAAFSSGQKQKLQNRQEGGDSKDVEDLGVILLEIIVGRPIMYRNEVSVLKDLVSTAADDTARRSIVDPEVQKECSNESLRTIVELCTRCLSDEPSMRPSIGDVLWNLQFAAQVQESWKGDCCLQIHQDSTASSSSQA
ncbi:unnamed protein product [Linum tenue]|uniref:Protein kinase domain-containing protein n=1 Tax=Linum tenue TaxID=586396 RepID=A0AAV0JKS5_9ROSI|nr:unnamed protein product [Linum tenue]